MRNRSNSLPSNMGRETRIRFLPASVIATLRQGSHSALRSKVTISASLTQERSFQFPALRVIAQWKSHSISQSTRFASTVSRTGAGVYEAHSTRMVAALERHRMARHISSSSRATFERPLPQQKFNERPRRANCLIATAASPDYLINNNIIWGLALYRTVLDRCWDSKWRLV